MTFTRLVFRNLRYHWRGNLAVMLGVTVATIVLTGALMVGDSLRGSLQDVTLNRLGWVDEAMVTPHFFCADLADNVMESNGGERTAPAILLQGSAQSVKAQEATDPLEQAGLVRRVNVLGVDDRFWGESIPDGPNAWKSASGNVVYLNAALRKDLGVAVGDEVVLNVQKKSEVPAESLLGKRDDSIEPLRLKVAGELAANDPMSNFSLSPTTETPRNAFVPLILLQTALKQAGRANAILTKGGDRWPTHVSNTWLTLGDWNLKLRTPKSRVQELRAQNPDGFQDGALQRFDWKLLPESFLKDVRPRGTGKAIAEDELRNLFAQRSPYISVESESLFLSPEVEKAVLAAAKTQKMKVAPTLVYLANSISDGTNSIPYSIVAGVAADDPVLIETLRPLVQKVLAEDEIVLVDWPESPLKGKPGDKIYVTYYEPDTAGKPKERTATFKLVGPPVKLAGATADPNLTPPFPGVTDSPSIDVWNAPFPVDKKRIKGPDNRYWNAYRTTPKAYISLAAAEKLWKSRFGNRTSIRLYPATVDYEAEAQAFGDQLRKELIPSDGGFRFNSVKQESLNASRGGDFAGLFLGFSFFLIVSALLLVGLLFRLNLDRRASEVGLLLACGHRPFTIRMLYLTEGSIVSLVGGIIGGLLGIAYAAGLLEYLRRTWPGGQDLPFLRLHVFAPTLSLGVSLGFIVSMITVWWVVRGLRKIPPRSLLQGQTQAASELVGVKPRWSLYIAGVSVFLALVALIAGTMISGQQERAGSFFGAGALLLTAGLAGLWAWMRRPHQSRTPGRGMNGVMRLGVRNAGRYPMRSLLTAGLLASAAFLVVAAECFRRDVDKNYLDKNSGSGGFALMAESELPIYYDFKSDESRETLLKRVDKMFEKHPAETRQAKRAEADKVLKSIKVFSFRAKSGDDASCLNLYQPKQPRILGVPHDLVERGGFSFAATEAKTPEQKANPWLLLEERPKQSCIPVMGEQNTVMWMLHATVGVDVSDHLHITGLMHDSVFQSSLLMSEKHFLERYPQEQGYRVFLIETSGDEGEQKQVKRWLEAIFAAEGLEVTSTKTRLESYLAVENMYLSTFQALGGLGLLLGSLGLAVVLLRSVWERRGELALLRALGFRKLLLGVLVLAENGYLLLMGLLLGTTAAVVAVVPQVLQAGGSVPWARLLGMMGLVLIVGLAATMGAVASTVRAALLPALRRE